MNDRPRHHMPKKKSPAQLSREIAKTLSRPARHHASTKKQTYRIELRFDVHGTQAEAERAAQAAASQVGGEVTAIFDEEFEEI
jgi:hypothetical protein